MTEYRDAVEYINSIVKFTKKNTLDHTRQCLLILGNPDRRFRSVHVAGTNGKGSTCAFLSSVLKKSGYKTGLFTSPHLMSINERFRINGENVDDAAFVSAFEKVKSAADQMVSEGSYHPTYFEFLFLMACVIFDEKDVEIAVMETGLGGRLDATNVLERPLASIITSISRDHMQYLGDTIEEIAGEKAGIIKPGVYVIYDDGDEKAAEVIRNRADEVGAQSFPLSRAGIEYGDVEKHDFTIKLAGITFNVPFKAPYQLRNAGLAAYALAIMSFCGLRLDPSCVKSGIEEAVWPGRMQQLSEKVFADGAHNEGGISEFIRSAKTLAGDEEITIVFAAMADKDYESMIHAVANELKPAHVITTKPEGSRAADPSALADLFEKEGISHVETVGSSAEALKKAEEMVNRGYVFFVGSLYFIGEILEKFGENNDQF